MAGAFADAELAAYVAEREAMPATLDVAAMRAGTAARRAQRSAGPHVDGVRDLELAGRPARLYRPAPGPTPLVVYLHGGGWTLGDLDSHDRVCRRLALGAGVAVLALDYRLAPEHPWPASVDDAVAALRWVSGAPAELGDPPTSIAVAGDSAGGTLAALACLRVRDEAPQAAPALAVLIYPNTDLTGAQPSMTEKATGFAVTAETIRFLAAQWVPDPARRGDPGVSPLHAPHLAGLPPTVVITAEHDPLRDEAEAYAARMREAGVEVELRREDGLVHGFMALDDISPACAAAADRVAADVAAHLRSAA